VTDRPEHDQRYATDATRIKRELGARQKSRWMTASAGPSTGISPGRTGATSCSARFGKSAKASEPRRVGSDARRRPGIWPLWATCFGAAAAVGSAPQVPDTQHRPIGNRSPSAGRCAGSAERPWLVVNTTAYTAVDGAVSERNLAFAVNADAPAAIAQACKQVGAIFVHASTDYVFDGTASIAYTETDPIGAINVYGESKAKGEEQVRRAIEQHVILRTSWVFARSGNNFVRSMLRLAICDRDIAVVDDQFGTPTDAARLATLIATMANRLANGFPGAFGTSHATGGAPVTWFRFAEAIFASAARQCLPRPRLRPTTTNSYVTAAARPRFSLLDCSALARDWGLTITPWTVAFDETVGFVMGDLKGRDS
jgi:dTDP-4-dehydrorhamnose reductase